MRQIWEQREVRLVVLVAVTLILIAIGVYIVKWLMRRLHGHGDEDQLGPSAALANFEEMHARGDLSDAEFRTIKTRLVRELQSQMGVTDQPD